MRTAAIRVAALAALLLSASAYAADIKPIVIDDDPGGLVSDHTRWYERIRDSGVPVILRGMCVSSCTFVLTLPKSQVCVEPTASLGFHMASLDDDKPDPGLTGALIRRWYPETIRRWLATKDMGQAPLYMSAGEIVKLGVFDACPSS